MVSYAENFNIFINHLVLCLLAVKMLDALFILLYYFVIGIQYTPNTMDDAHYSCCFCCTLNFD